MLPAAMRAEVDRLIVDRAFSGYQALADGLQAMGYRGCIDAQILLGAAFDAITRAMAEIMRTGSFTGIDDAGFTRIRKEIEDLIGLDAYYRIEAETVEPASRPG